MPIKFVSLNKKFIENMDGNYESHLMKIQDYVPDKKTYYVSAANSLCFMDGGIDYALSRIVFPGIETVVKQEVKCLNIKNMLLQIRKQAIKNQYIQKINLIILIIYQFSSLLYQYRIKVNLFFECIPSFLNNKRIPE